MSWNFRIIKSKKTFYIAEVFYYKNGKIKWWSEPEHLWGDSVKDLKHQYKMMEEAFTLPVLKLVNGELK